MFILMIFLQQVNNMECDNIDENDVVMELEDDAGVDADDADIFEKDEEMETDPSWLGEESAEEVESDLGDNESIKKKKQIQ